jgi:hypothetical protein
VSAANTRPCPHCKKPIPSDASRCPHCNADLSIITMPIEAVPPDVGVPDEEEAAIEPARAEILPPKDEAVETRGGSSRSYSMSTSFSTTMSAGGTARHVDAKVKVDLPQPIIDPDGRLSSVAYWRLMQDWSKAIEREIEAASDAGRGLSPADAVRRVPLPFGPDSGGDLPLAIRDEMSRRAQAEAAKLFSLPKPADVFGPHAGPDSDLPMRQLLERAGQTRRRGVTVTCGGLLAGALLLCGAVAAVIVWWVAA